MSNEEFRDTLLAPPRSSGRAAGAVLANRYRLERLIGAGGMGEVWEARHLMLDRVVALKLLGIRQAEVAERLLREARALARVRHPAVVEIHDCGLLEDGTPYLAMERLVGETLAALVARGPLSVTAAVGLFVTLLDGLVAAHRAGVIHRDLKPDNIFLARDDAGVMRPRLLDFGIAIIDDGDTRSTRAGAMLGTPSYMSPEQFRGQHSDERTDVWGATASLYEAMCGGPPFGDDTLPAVMRRVLDAPVPYPRHVEGIDGKLWAILARGLRKLPEDRFPTVEAMLDALRGWLDPAASAARPPLGAPSTAAQPSVARATTAPVPRPATVPDPAPPPVRSTLDDAIRRKLRGD